MTCIFNPAGYKSRTKLYHKFAEYLKSINVVLITIELQYGKIPFEATEPDNPNHIQLRTDSVMWHKEQLVNLATQRLPMNWEYMAWIDADLLFLNDNWVHDTIRTLQFHPVVQMFGQAHDLSITNEIIATHQGIGWAYVNDKVKTEDVYTKMYGTKGQHYGIPIEKFEKIPKTKVGFFHPGFAWAIRRDAYNNMGGLLDCPILGSADTHMAYSFIGCMESTLHEGYSEPYKDCLRAWQARADKYIRRNLGYVPGSVVHYWHGRKKDRGYTTRFNILIDNQYNPHTDIEKDHQGLYRWTDRSLKLRQDVYKYFLSRNEDLTIDG